MNQVEVCNLRKNLQHLKLNANNIISFISKQVNFNSVKNYSNTFKFAV